jgi:hypothetical protein
MASIGGSVGEGGANNEADVLTVQKLLNGHVGAMGLTPLDEDGQIGDNTNGAIRRYQEMVLDMSAPDGRIDPGGRTWTSLSAGTGVQAPPAPAAGKASLSGSAWWHTNQANFPNSSKLADLASPFREKAIAFIDALKAAGAQVSVTSTLRNPTRAYLMHYSGKVAGGAVAPSAVPAKSGCPIVWDHGNLAQSKAAAQEMYRLFNIKFPASLTSLHIEGQAVDMTIGWTGILSIADANGKVHAIGAPRSGETNHELHAVGATYGVHKLLSDAPHWSSTGH